MVKLYIVGTPIGNINDITLRALQILKSVNYIACEDTRITKKLLTYFQIKNKKLIICNDKNEKKITINIIKIIKEGNNVVLVSDAGMPTINDPGFFVIKSALKAEIDIEIIPGVSAITSASVLSNFDTRFHFHGFFHYKTTQRKKQLKNLTNGTHIFFASPHRIYQELIDIKNVLKENFKIFVGRELTKKFETHYRGNIDEIIKKINKQNKGEYTIVLEIQKQKNK